MRPRLSAGANVGSSHLMMQSRGVCGPDSQHHILLVQDLASDKPRAYDASLAAHALLTGPVLRHADDRRLISCQASSVSYHRLLGVREKLSLRVARGTAMKAKRIVQGGAAVIGCLLAATVSAQEVDVEAIVNGQFALGGNHPKVRASGAKGVCVKGRFAPSAEAATLSKAPHFAKAVPVMARFSMGGSNPKISDKTKPVTRGFSMRFTDPVRGHGFRPDLGAGVRLAHAAAAPRGYFRAVAGSQRKARCGEDQGLRGR